MQCIKMVIIIRYYDYQYNFNTVSWETWETWETFIVKYEVMARCLCRLVWNRSTKSQTYRLFDYFCRQEWFYWAKMFPCHSTGVFRARFPPSFATCTRRFEHRPTARVSRSEKRCSYMRIIFIHIHTLAYLYTTSWFLPYTEGNGDFNGSFRPFVRHQKSATVRARVSDEMSDGGRRRERKTKTAW